MSTDTNLFRGMNLPIVNNGELGSSWASYREHQDMESDKLCNNTVNSWPATSPTKSTVLFCSVEFQDDRGGKGKAGAYHTNRKRDYDIRKKKKLLELISSSQFAR